MTDKMCFMSVANSVYQGFIPWYIFFLQEAYPEAHKTVLIDGCLSDSASSALSILDANYIIRENAFSDFGSNIDKNTIKMLRWLTYIEEFDSFDCLSIGDIDFAICKENPSYMEQHLSHCDDIGLPYSNFVRPERPRLSGVHVVRPREWFAVMRPIMRKYRKLLKSGKLVFERPSGANEQLLFKMVAESSFGTPQDTSSSYNQCITSSAHHGVHLRLVKKRGIKGYKRIKNYSNHRNELRRICETSKFKQLSQLSPDIADDIRLAASA